MRIAFPSMVVVASFKLMEVYDLDTELGPFFLFCLLSHLCLNFRGDGCTFIFLTMHHFHIDSFMES